MNNYIIIGLACILAFISGVIYLLTARELLQSHFLAETSTATIEASVATEDETRSLCPEKEEKASASVATPRPLKNEDIRYHWFDDKVIEKSVEMNKVLGMVEWIREHFAGMNTNYDAEFTLDVLDEAVREIR